MHCDGQKFTQNYVLGHNIEALTLLGLQAMEIVIVMHKQLDTSESAVQNS